MHYDKANLAAVECASTDATRYILNGVRFEEDKTVATDGRILVLVDNPKVCTPPKELPEPIFKEPIVIDRNDCKSLAKSSKARRGATEKEQLHKQLLALHHNGNGVEFASTELTIKALPLDGAYPNYAQCIPSTSGRQKVTLSLKSLKHILELMKQCEADEITLHIEDEYKPIVAEAEFRLRYDQEDRKLKIVFMPNR